jgi:hypothetical protein
MAEVETATTAHGEVEYEVVECSSCGQKIREEDAVRFVVGELNDKKSYTHGERYNFNPQTVNEGWACDICREDPAGFPTTDRSVSINAEPLRYTLIGLGAIATCLFWPVGAPAAYGYADVDMPDAFLPLLIYIAGVLLWALAAVELAAAVMGVGA